MSSNISRGVLDAMLPPGSLWQPGEGFDELLDGIALNAETPREFLGNLAYIRDPLRTPVLSDLEKEYGVVPTVGASEEERRLRLLGVVISRDGDGTAAFMESALQSAGFDVLVHVNDPPQDPGLLADTSYIVVTGEPEAVTGEPEAVTGLTLQSGGIDGELVVNCEVIYHPRTLSTITGNQYASTGSTFSHTGSLHALEVVPVEYEIPADPGYWGLFFFVGGEATRNPVTGIIETIEKAEIPIERRSELKRLIIKYKPMYSWGVLVADYI